MNAPRLLRASEVAALLGISLRTLWRMDAEGRLTGKIRVGKRSSRWSLRSIEMYIARRAA